MSYFTFSGNKLVMTALAAGALAVGGTGVAAMADSHDGPVAPIESPTPEPTDTVTPEPTPTETETASPDPEPTETETAEPEPTGDPEPTPEPTETDDSDADDPETDDPEEGPAATPVGPDVTGAAAAGLCNAFEHGGLNSTSTAYTVLMQVAGGDEAIDDYCATIPAPQERGEGSIDDGSDNGTTPGEGDGIVQPQSVELQNEGAPASNGANGSPGSSGGAGHQGNSAKHSHHG
ncbi:hypothetical protein ACIQC0_02630 [Pseudarthrobacter sp. NPDC092419]|uniref:hypothetical protein n=1 Tax=Pseudarthrobacter sp. NPDC092419 TaxID=3364414 RepID=UPI00382E03C3